MITSSSQRAERARSALAKGNRLVELYTRVSPTGPRREELESIAWLAVVRSAEATPATMKRLQEDLLLMLMAAHRMGYLSGLREGEAGETESGQ